MDVIPPPLLLLSGTGKTMLMDMFYSCVETPRKKRVHFNGFMLDIHKSQYPASNCDCLVLFCPLSLCCFCSVSKCPQKIVFHYSRRWSRCFRLYCLGSRVCRCRCSLKHVWHLCTAWRDPPEETKPSKTNAGETVHLWPHIAGCRGDRQRNLPALLWRVSGEHVYFILSLGFEVLIQLSSKGSESSVSD